jgi:Tfp pilus assembly protein PilF
MLPASAKRAITAPQNDEGLFVSPEKRNSVLCLLLIALTLALYNGVTQSSFLNYDDDRYVTHNLHVRAGLRWKTVTWAFTTTEQANWHPLTWLSHALDCQFFHLNPAGHHYTNVLLHAVNVVLLFLLLQRATGFTGRSLMVAALFAFHPINVESVAWVSERKNLLSMLFFLLALGAYGCYARKPGVGRYVLVALLFALGLMAKPMVITLPFVLLLCDCWPLRRMRGTSQPPASGGAAVMPLKVRPFSFLVLEKLPLLVLTTASAIITMRAQRAGGAVRSEMEYPLSVRLENAIVSYARYVGKAIWPSRLSPMYPHPGGWLEAWQVLAAVALRRLGPLRGIAARRQQYLAVGWFWFLGTLVPMIGLVQVGGQAMADRYAYLPFVGVFVVLCWGVAEWAERRHLSAGWLVVPSAVVLMALSVLTYWQVGYWHDSVTLWSRALQVTNRNFVAQDNLGGALVNEGRIEDAMPHFRAAVEIHPSDPFGHLNICTYEQQHGNLQQAIEQCQMTLRRTSDTVLQANAYGNLGSAYRSLRNYTLAKENYEAALRLMPDNAPALVGLGLLAQRTGDFAQAVNQYSRAVTVQPTDTGYLLLARALEQSGHPAEAQTAYEEAKRLSQDLDKAKQNADYLLSQ